MGTALMAGIPDVVFNGIGSLPEDMEQYPPFRVHELFTLLLKILVVLHILAALYHQFVLKDHIFKRLSLK